MSPPRNYKVTKKHSKQPRKLQMRGCTMEAKFERQQSVCLQRLQFGGEAEV